MRNNKIIPLPTAANEQATGSGATARELASTGHRLSDSGGSAPSNIIPFPISKQKRKPVASNVLLFPLAEAGVKQTCNEAETELPGTLAHLEETAYHSGCGAWSIDHRKRRSSDRSRANRRLAGSASRRADEKTSYGTSSARIASGMNSATRSARSEPLNEINDPALAERRAKDEEFRTEESIRADSPADVASAMEWQEGRPVGRLDRSAPGHPSLTEDASPTADRIFFLLFREALLARQSGSESMTVMLRTDEDAELVLHLTQNNGRLDAAVRCERGDLPQLRALWSQVQEAMALQRIRLAPLQAPLASEFLAPKDAGEGIADVESAAAAIPLAQNQFMDERPSPASPVSAPHVRRRRSRSRLATSRPGWETWA